VAQLKLCSPERPSEADVGAEGDAQIMVRAAGEIDFVAGVETKTDGSEAAFHAGTGVENAGEII